MHKGKWNNQIQYRKFTDATLGIGIIITGIIVAWLWLQLTGNDLTGILK